ncbi:MULTISPECIES: bifunctional glutamate N-acetyltransferase/amino-acid acetyltransferase ArgJ [unclassified Nitratiruptor]|uniref:bifunctional glutamate N-acetyltransferase/amino-acid acetyltransferase ArgJ n=1 Tax=unclassified Nitratiruptor TaxID=2624044 RepID=UPI001916A072|nr:MULTISPECIES: bifunctional glutamate N-acetyltransferase/amino-acid acetyltransferase ArgJ [unclassified Nitratiruptor]BCD59652.1 glutamate N-acetyltransferase / amino-acid N-acetyltransferase [Nitratiruptor sp. YY08-10]BCD63576.1 glutamate N-acetyltransferase / amino-acid N-acetyltransferase [Nitratiruptor sp. YY08-14]
MHFQLFPIQNPIEHVEGFYCDGVMAGLKKEGLDLGFLYSDTPANVAAIFTQNRFQAAPIKHFQKHAIKTSNFILVNSKNANAITSDEGIEDIEEIVSALQTKFSLHNPIMSSTGVIGVRLPKEKIINAALSFDLHAKNSERFAKAIMTTDTFPKYIGFKVELDNGSSFHIAGFAKGAGMINPTMATMLCFIVTDANIPQEAMKPLLQKYAQTTFNAISVDGDTSTNDSVFLMANGKSGTYDQEAFEYALYTIMHHLALQIVKDGEGAKKLVAFKITGAANDKEAQIAAKALTNSLLVKTALFGEDPNWGRIASTIGASGVECDEKRLTISIGDVVVYDKGQNLFDAEQEEKAHQVMKQDEFVIHCDLGINDGSFTAYGCDLGYEYVKINAEYRT